MRRFTVALTVWLFGLAWVLASVTLPGGSASAATPTSTATTPGGFTALPPTRMLDTRLGVGAPRIAVAAGGTVHLRVAGSGGVPASVSAVVLSVTVTTPAKPGYMTVYGDGATRPAASNLNYLAGQTAANLVIAPVGAGGNVNLYNGSPGTVQLIADVSGYYLAGSPTVAGAFGSLAPSRLLDSRTGVGAPKAAVAAGGTVHLRVTGRGGVPPSGISAVVVNLTVTAPAKPGYVTVYGDGTSRPAASNLSYVAGQTAANLVIAPVGAGGNVNLFNGSPGTVQMIADVCGYFLAGPPTVTGAFGSLALSRLLDTRTGVGAPAAAVTAGGTVAVKVTGGGGVPASGVSSVVLTVTATAAVRPGFVTAYGHGGPLPTTSSLNFVAGRTVSNLVIAPVGTSGMVDLFNGSPGTVHLLADVSGYVADPVPQPIATVTNFSLAGHQVTTFDVDGNAVDAHDGDLTYFAGKYYLYGTSYSCGYQLNIAGSAFCGFKSYSSVDLVNWTDNGFLFGASTPLWQTRCAPPRYGCYRPHVLHNTTTGKYVLWINSYDSDSGYHVFTADTPGGPFVETAQPVLADMGVPAPGTYVNGDFDLFQDDDGNAYINYSHINIPAPAGQASHILRVQKLDITYTTGVGPAVSPGATGVEAISLFKKDGTYYVIYGPTCSYCGGSNTMYRKATDPLGAWSAGMLLNTTSCGGQPSFVAKLPTAARGWTYVYGSDLWHAGFRNQGLANFYWDPLSFSGTGIQPFTCSNTVAIDRASNATGAPNLPAQLDQTSGTGIFSSVSDISSGWSRAQSFTAGRSGMLTSVSVPTFQQGKPNAGLKLEVYRADTTGAPTGSALFTVGRNASALGWSPTTFVTQPKVPVTAGARYAIVLTTASTIGSYGWEYSDENPYLVGGGLYRRTGGGWTAEAGRDLKFLTTVQ